MKELVPAKPPRNVYLLYDRNGKCVAAYTHEQELEALQLKSKQPWLKMVTKSQGVIVSVWEGK